MSNDERVKALNKKIVTKLPYSDTIPNKKTFSPNTSSLKVLAKKIRKTVEDYTVETPIHTESS